MPGLPNAALSATVESLAPWSDVGRVGCATGAAYISTDLTVPFVPSPRNRMW